MSNLNLSTTQERPAPRLRRRDPETPRDYILASVVMHPSLLADGLEDVSRIHRRSAQHMTSGAGHAAADRASVKAAKAARLVRAADVDAIMSEVALWVPAFHVAAALNLIPHLEAIIVSQFPSGHFDGEDLA